MLTEGAAAALLARGGVDAVIVGARPRRRQRRHRQQDRHLRAGDRRPPPRRAVLRRGATLDARPGERRTAPRSRSSSATAPRCGPRRRLPDDVAVWNPAFDVTPASLITAIVSDAGRAAPALRGRRSPGRWARPRGREGRGPARAGRPAGRGRARAGARAGRGRARDRRGAELRHRREVRGARPSLDRRLPVAARPRVRGRGAGGRRGRRARRAGRPRVLRQLGAVRRLPAVPARAREPVRGPASTCSGGFAEQVLVPERIVERRTCTGCRTGSTSGSPPSPSRSAASSTRSTVVDLAEGDRAVGARRRLARADALRAARLRAAPQPIVLDPHPERLPAARALRRRETVRADRGRRTSSACASSPRRGRPRGRGGRPPRGVGARRRDGRARRHGEPVRRLRARQHLHRPDRARALRRGHAHRHLPPRARATSRARWRSSRQPGRGRSCSGRRSTSSSSPTRSRAPPRPAAREVHGLAGPTSTAL